MENGFEKYRTEFEKGRNQLKTVIVGSMAAFAGLVIGALHYEINLKPVHEYYSQKRVDYVVKNFTPKTAKIGDVNKDGVDDLIVKCEFHDNILLGRKDGTFEFLEGRPSYWEKLDGR
jgi:hypothetical protein